MSLLVQSNPVLADLKNKINYQIEKAHLKSSILISFLLFSLFSFAQTPILVLEAENAELTLPSKVKYVTGYSGNAYVGDNDPGSSIVFRNVSVENEGTYEFRTFYTSMHLRSIAIQSGFYPAVVSTCPIETEDWNRPPVGTMFTYIYLNKGNNTIKITPHNGGGPNIDKFEIWETTVSMPRPDIQRSAFSYDITDDALITINNVDESKSVINDNDEFTVYSYNGSSAEIYIECNMPYLLTGYLLSAGPANTDQIKNWKVEYSLDGNAYSVINATRSENLNTAVLFHINRSPHTEPEKAAKYYRVTATGGSIGDVQLFGIPYLPNNDGKNFPTDITHDVDIQSKVIGNPLGTFISFADERCFNLFDRNMSKKYYWGNDRTFDVEIELNDLYNLSHYTLSSCQDYPERDPKSWVVEGFDRDWEVVSEVRNFKFPCRYATMKFKTDINKRYRGFRLRVTENNGSDAFQILKWQLFGDNEEISSLKRHTNNQVKISASSGEIKIYSDEIAHCRIADLSGQLIKELVLSSDISQIKMCAGVYIINVISDQYNTTSKVIVR